VWTYSSSLAVSGMKNYGARLCQRGYAAQS
jgi:hypothetical protein